ncbi:probable LRR receptor-like serine/threonine-protein kinase At3g47570 [Hibiscus syriacus]|uniref:probable LRR receptor-like serine/threonine-protein kinase At3g47570 n=1 Tax=Hibiscus syriacus TaxID=106335 RepID=UPI001924B7B8|nr:probable LRR receptor-like serine/threonine-protein kinase At3g47570 [Hibiscus syriacus]
MIQVDGAIKNSYGSIHLSFLIILLSCFKLQGLGLATATHVVRGNESDHQALLQFKAKITDDQLRVMECWNSSIHFCHWYGVTCGHKHQRVTKLELKLLKLSGSLSPYIGNLSFLRKFNLAGNSFSNQIPQEFGRLRRLESLNLVNNSISGEIPSNLSACSKLTSVDMRSNQLTGEIPASLGLLSNLKFLILHNNSLRGSIPPSLGNLSSLQVLSLLINGLSGTIPEALGQLKNLSVFSIAGNAISGVIPLTMFNLSNIRDFDVGGNKIQGTLPSDLAITMPYLEFFSVQGNQFSGKIPISISNASNLKVLQFQDNSLNGNVPSLEKLDNLFRLCLNTNHLGVGREGDLHFLCTLVNNTKLETLAISQNNFGGAFPQCISNFSTTLLNLDISENKIWGGIPKGIGNLMNLEVLVASQNQLSGHIPHVIGRLGKLKILFADNNLLTGTIPYSIGNLVVLTKLAIDSTNLQGSIPSSLGKCRNLVAMNISHNNLSGPIPPEVLIPSLSIALDLSSNNLTGSKFLVSFGSLKYLNLSFNDFEGEIPSEGVFKKATATFVEGNIKLCGGIHELHLSRCNSKTSSNPSLRLKTTLVVVVILGVILVFSFLLILWFRKKKEQQPKTTCVENVLLQLSYRSILRATNGFSTQNLIGSGSFGSVYRGILEDSGAVIAVKVLNLLNHGASKSFLAECEALKNIRHRNLVKILTTVSGVDYQGNDFKALVYEFMVNGNLDNWLHLSVNMNEPETTRNLNFSQRVNVAINVAHALDYLHHHCEAPIIHCDLKPSNILLDEEMVGHLSDFGLAKVLSTNKLNYSANKSSSLELRGTIGYAPPEYGMGSKLSTKGDVYSYGILLLEMFTGKRPTDATFEEGLCLHKFVETAWPGRIMEIIDPILLHERDERGTIVGISLNGTNTGNKRHFRCLNSIFEIGLNCSSESPSERMDMHDVVTKLCSVRDELLPTRLHRTV